MVERHESQVKSRTFIFAEQKKKALCPVTLSTWSRFDAIRQSTQTQALEGEREREREREKEKRGCVDVLIVNESMRWNSE